MRDKLMDQLIQSFHLLASTIQVVNTTFMCSMLVTDQTDATQSQIRVEKLVAYMPQLALINAGIREIALLIQKEENGTSEEKTIDEG